MRQAPETENEVRDAIRRERRHLTESLDELRGELHEATDVGGRLGAVLPLAVTGALGAGFVLGGGIGATVRLLLRRGREGTVKAKAGRYAVVQRD